MKLAEFTVRKEGNTAVLNWETAQESNTDYFSIERSEYAKSWNTIGSRTAAGESNGLLKYAFSDVSPLKGINYYRLKMYDKDLTFSFSRLQSIKMEENVVTIEIFPNPTSEVLILKNFKEANIKEVDIVNLNGHSMFKSSTGSLLNSSESIDVSKWPGGMYIVKTVDKNDVVSKHKILVSR